jgi:methylenetetrahydrofolate dehydrogenase (NADP+)/methenyltetrahydrofolate cyclohydrolase
MGYTRENFFVGGNKLTMTAQIINGLEIASALRETVKAGVLLRHNAGFPAPGLAVIKIGHNPASELYVANKRKACASVGILSFDFDLSDGVSEERVLRLIDELNHREDIHGILVQLPLPPHINTYKIIEAIDPHKDVDGFHPFNIGLLVQRRPKLRPCTPKGITHLLKKIPIQLEGLHAVVVGASNIVGRPMGMELLLEGCTITMCHHLTRDITEHTKRADILISAVGKPNLIQAHSIKPGAVVIDVGINRLENGSLVGDVDFNSVKEIAGWITPVPGGVGPMTVAALLENTLMAANALTILKN